MNEYQRKQLDKLPMNWKCRECPYIDQQPHLPFEILQAAQKGNVDMIKDYLDKDGDVNALHERECLLSRACAEGQVEIVKLLLQCPEVHLSMKFDGCTPLNRAVKNNHMDIVRLLIDATVHCNIQLDSDWGAISKCLKMQPLLQPRSVTHILRCALHQRQLDVLQILLESKYHIEKDDLYPLLLVCIEQDCWNIVYIVLKRDFYGKTEVVNEVLAVAVNMMSWEKVDTVLCVIDSDLKFEVPFVEAALAGRFPEAQNLLAEGQYDPQTLNGNVLVLAAGGMNDRVAELLMTVKHVYTKRTLSNALFLAALGNNEDLLLRLLHNPEASFSFNDLHQANEVLVRVIGNVKCQGNLVKFINNYVQKRYGIIE